MQVSEIARAYNITHENVLIPKDAVDYQLSRFLFGG